MSGAVIQEAGAGEPDAGDVVAAYAVVREWVNRFNLPQVETDEARIEIRGASAALVLLRSAGRMVGVGIDATGDDRMLRRAAGKALSDLTGDPGLARMPIEQRDQIGSRVTLELEVAGAMTPLIASSWADVGRQIRPGLDGVAMRRGDDWVVRFPAHLRAINAGQVASFLPGLLAELEITPGGRDLDEMRAEEGLSIYSFTTIHLAQPTPVASPFTTLRGGRVVAAEEVNAASISQFCNGLVRHLLAHGWERRSAEGEMIGDEPLGMFGSYDPVSGRFMPLVAPPFEQALASYALSHFARTPGVDQQVAQEAAAFAEQILVELADVVRDSEPDPNDDPGASAMIVLAVDELIQNPSVDIRELAGLARTRLWKTFDTQAGGFVPLPGSDGQMIPVPSQLRAMIAAAMARMLLKAEPLPGGALAVRMALDATWLSADQVEQVGLLPWIGWAEMDYAAATSASPPEAAERLATLRSLLWASQVGIGAGRAEPDLIGGFGLAGPFGTQVTAQGIRPAAWLARRAVTATAAEERGEGAAEVGRLLLFGRFLVQLGVREEDGWSYRNPRVAAGGVREAVWDSWQPLPAQALALLTASDILRALGALQGH